LMIAGMPSEYGLPFDFGFLAIIATVLIVIGGRLYARIGQ